MGQFSDPVATHSRTNGVEVPPPPPPGSDYSLNICFSRRFPHIDGASFSPHKPIQNVNFSKVGNKFFSGIVLTY